MAKLQFPLNEDLQKYGASIEFYPFTPKGMEDVVAQIKAAAGLAQASSRLKDVQENKGGVDPRDPNSEERERRLDLAKAQANLNKATKTVNTNAGTTLKKRTSGQRRVDNSELGKLGGIKLYMPGSIVISDGVNISNVDFGVLGQAGIEALRSGAGGFEVAGQAAKDVVNNLSDIFRTSLGDGEVAQAGLLRALRATPGLNKVADIASQASRVSVNPNTQARFAGVGIRSFNFTFTLMPSSDAEQQVIKDIIKKFRTELYPDLITGTSNVAGTENIALGYKFPNQWKIKLKYGNKDIATGLLPCYLKDFSATYNSQSMGFHKGGGFTDVQITLGFTETETLSRRDIESGNF